MQRIYFLGIGGSAMGALACACKDAGHVVSGSDNGIYSPMKEFLEQRAIPYADAYSIENIKSFNPDIVVVGNAMSRGNEELEFALDQRLDLWSMPDLLRQLFIKKNCSVVVSGTHGKTTTSSLCSWMLATAHKRTGFFIGAVTGNFGLGCRSVPEGHDKGFFVSEGDEYDTAFFDKRSKFLLYRPDIALINNIEFDHADIFQSIEDIKKSFRLFARLVPRNGLIIANADDKNVQSVVSTALAPVVTFGLGSAADWRAVDVHYDVDATHMTVLKKGIIYHRFSTSLLGEHNVMNILSMVALSHHLEIAPQIVQDSLDTFVPPKRRLELIGSFQGAPVVDDFAHHPTAIRLTIGAAIQKFPTKRIIACFEPRSNTTARNFFQDDLIHAFDEADEVVIGCINRPERFSKDERLDRDQLASSLRDRGKTVFVATQAAAPNSHWGDEVAEYFASHVSQNDLLLLLSNGDFGGLRSMLTKND